MLANTPCQKAFVVLFTGGRLSTTRVPSTNARRP
jgi:hypothetical protein